MANQNPSLRFDHREIAVIFSLFIFVSLLMFTVGILVGKGLAQARYEGILLNNLSDHGHAGRTAALGSSGAAGSDNLGDLPGPDAEARRLASGRGPDTAPLVASSSATAAASGAADAVPAPATDEKGAKKAAEPLQLIPQHAKNPDVNGGSLQEPPSSKESDHILKDPRIRALIDDQAGPKRSTASGAPGAASSKVGPLPPSFAKGPYTVQVGSYATQKDATERVESLKKLGFPYAYFSAKELEEKKDTWFRVWLGYYPDKNSAEKSGAVLQQRGEVKSYLVRKTDSHG